MNDKEREALVRMLKGFEQALKATEQVLARMPKLAEQARKAVAAYAALFEADKKKQ